MKPDEARAWLRGWRSTTKMPGENGPTRYAMIEVANAACMVQALVVLLAEQEGLLADPPLTPEQKQRRRESGCWDG